MRMSFLVCIKTPYSMHEEGGTVQDDKAHSSRVNNAFRFARCSRTI